LLSGWVSPVEESRRKKFKNAEIDMKRGFTVPVPVNRYKLIFAKRNRYEQGCQTSTLVLGSSVWKPWGVQVSGFSFETNMAYNNLPSAIRVGIGYMANVLTCRPLAAVQSLRPIQFTEMSRRLCTLLRTANVHL
jgi:hypothetical protein